jgi:uncharacterized Fe-S cluster protein YjdI/CDGSH-type Zn-finger protein
MAFTIAARASRSNLPDDREMTGSRRLRRQEPNRTYGERVRKVYRGRDVEVSFDLDICVHIGECLRGEPRVFDLDRRPWVLPDAAEADQVAEVVRRCPSGALLYRRLDGAPQEEPDSPVRVTPLRDGPLLVTGAIEVRHEGGTVETLPRATLCRCGESRHKPFCDNQHLAVGFRAPGLPFRIHLSPVRRDLDKPMTKAEDPRGR